MIIWILLNALCISWVLEKGRELFSALSVARANQKCEGLIVRLKLSWPSSVATVMYADDNEDLFPSRTGGSEADLARLIQTLCFPCLFLR